MLFFLFLAKISNKSFLDSEVNNLAFKIISIAIFFVLVLLFMPFYINIKIQRENSSDKIEFKILLFKGLIKFGIEIPFIDIIMSGSKPSIEIKEKIEEGSKEKDIAKNKQVITFKKLLEYIEKGFEFKDILHTSTRYLIKKIKIIKVIWRTSVGFENAAITGVLTGGVWSIKGFILSIILNGKKINDIKLNVIPQYDQNIFETYIDCIIKIKLVYIIIAGLNGLEVKLKGGEVDE